MPVISSPLAQNLGLPHERAWAIRPGSVFLPGGKIERGLDVVIQRDVVVGVVPQGSHEIPAEDIVEALGSTLLPGLIDSHVHLTFSADSHVVENLLAESVPNQLTRAVGNAQLALSRGVTTAIDCGGQTEICIALRDGIAAGRLTGPRLLVSGSPITTSAGHCYWLGGVADSREEVVQLLRSHVTHGVDFIKVMLTGGNLTVESSPSRLQYSSAVLAVIAAECDRLGKALVVHAHSLEAVEAAASVGARVIVHGTCSGEGGEIGLRDSTVALLLAGGSFVDPTLMVGREKGAGENSGASGRRYEQRRAMIPLFKIMRDAGVELLAGSDAGVPGVAHGSVSGSIVALHKEVGFSIEAALLAGTMVPARAFGLSHLVGSIGAGLQADLLLTSGLVEDDLEAVLRPRIVWKAGRVVSTEGLA